MNENQQPPSLEFAEKIKAFLGMNPAEKNKLRRAALADSFTRFLARKPMFVAPYGKERNGYGSDGVQLDALAEWSEEWSKWTQRTKPTDGVRRAEKAIRLARWHDRRRRLVKAKRAARVRENIARFAEAFNAAVGAR